VCVSVAAPDVATCRQAIASCDAAEIRLDAMALTPDEARALFATGSASIATCRPGRQDDDLRRDLLCAAIAGGASYVDVELDAPPALSVAVTRAARAHRCQLIRSFHDDRCTPPRAELAALRERCFEGGADLAKIACHVASRSDAARLLGLLDDERPTIIVGMGPLGRVVRIAAPLLGSPIAYASLGEGAETAPGQLDRTALERLLAEWRDG
jgi:3-dehydroquinate dehydratase-1